MHSPQMNDIVMVTPDEQVGRGFVDAPRVTGHACVGASIRQVGGADQQAAGLQQGEAGQLDRAAGQHAFACARGGKGEEEAVRKCQQSLHMFQRDERCPRTFLPGDGRPRGPGGLAVQDDGRAVNHGAVGGAGRDVGGDTCATAGNRKKSADALNDQVRRTR